MREIEADSNVQLVNSLRRQKERLNKSIILTPVDSMPAYLGREQDLDFIQGLYVTDKLKTEEEQQASKILFAGRKSALEDTVSIYQSWARELGGKQASLRLLSGLHAHIVIFMGLGKPGDRVLLLSEEAGGHFSTSSILERLGYEIIEIPIDRENRRIDLPKTAVVIKEAKPEFLFIDRSEGLVYEDFQALRESFEGYSIFDASQYLAAILAGRYPNPFTWGFDLMISSLHKSYPGPQKAVVITRELDGHWARIKQALGTFVSSTHIKNTYLSRLHSLEPAALAEYVDRKLNNATLLEAALARQGVPVVRRSESKHPTHHVWVRGDTKQHAYSVYQRLERVNLLTNFRQLPYGIGPGLRLGTNAASLLGLTENNIDRLASCLSRAFHNHSPEEEIRREVEEIALDMENFRIGAEPQ